MLTEQEIQRLLHASRVVPLDVPNPHGPLGLEQLAQAVAEIASCPSPSAKPRVGRPVELPAETWEKLDRLARAASPQPVSAAEMAAAILEKALSALP
jgi:hypothetical protein